ADERLHRVVGVHRRAAADARTAVERVARTLLGIGVSRDLERVHEIDRLTAHRVRARDDRSVRDEDRRLVVLEHRREGTYWRLVAGYDGDQASHVTRGEVEAYAVVHDLAADEREAHPVGAVQLPVGDTDRECRGDEPDGQVVANDPLREGCMDRLYLLGH